jgi:hypothetical protein
MYKICNRCCIEKEIKCFNKNVKRKDKLCISCRECEKEYHKTYHLNNKDKVKIQQKRWHLNNREYLNFYGKNRYNSNTNYRISVILRSRLYKTIKNLIKYKSALDLLGCNIDELKQYLESQFKENMTWENYGKIWEIDHIKPCSKFELSKLEEQQKCFCYTNLQPLFINENRIKSNKYETRKI